MENRLNISWPRILAEGAAIVVSILLAFSIQAWWDERQDRQDEKAVLASLLTEFEKLRAELEDSKIFSEAIIDSGRKLLTLATAPDNSVNDQSLDKLIATLWWNNNKADWSIATLETLVSTGDLELVTNVQLRHELGAWHLRLQRSRNSVSNEMEFYNERLMPFLLKNAYVVQIANSIDHRPGFPNQQYDTGEMLPVTRASSNSEILQNREFQNLIAERVILLNDTINFAIDGLYDDLNSIINMLKGAQLD